MTPTDDALVMALLAALCAAVIALTSAAFYLALALPRQITRVVIAERARLHGDAFALLQHAATFAADIAHLGRELRDIAVAHAPAADPANVETTRLAEHAAPSRERGAPRAAPAIAPPGSAIQLPPGPANTAAGVTRRPSGRYPSSAGDDPGDSGAWMAHHSHSSNDGEPLSVPPLASATRTPGRRCAPTLLSMQSPKNTPPISPDHEDAS